jgi:hypothetical protein
VFKCYITKTTLPLAFEIGYIAPQNLLKKITIMVRDLAFIQTWSVPQFKSNNGVQTIEIKKNEKTGKYFFVYGVETGACSNKVQTGELTMPVVSQVVAAATGETFYMLHQRGEGGGAATIATL